MLKRLELVGFKSFADKTQFDFPAGITAVVGPNGSGKSNVVDAVRWVLGEQSAKSLRGGEMADVIFNGSSSRRSLGLAEVTMTLDNSRRILALESEEVQITRRVYRDGEGEYLINQQLSRLRDIKELFLGSGAGTDAYSIIEQGRVDILLQASTKERRTIFEEAAGISRFKAKKIETLRKLERVDQNVQRLRDIIDEVEKQLRSVKLQAAKAERYQEYSRRLQELRVALGLQEYHQLAQQLQAQTAILDQLRASLAGQEAQHAAWESELRGLDAALEQIDQRLREQESSLAGAKQQITAEESTLRHEGPHALKLEADLAQLRRQLTELNARVATLAEAAGLAATELRGAEDRCRDQDGQVVTLEQELHSAERSLEELKKQIHADQAEHMEQMRKAGSRHNDAVTFKADLDNLRRERERLLRVTEERTEKVTSLDGVLEELQRENGILDDRLAATRQTLAEHRQAKERLQKLADDTRQLIAELREQRSGLASRIEVLEGLERTHEGLGSGVREVFALLELPDPGPWRTVLGMIADFLTVRREFAPLIDLALGDRAQRFLVCDVGLLEQALRQRTEPFSSRVSFLARSAAAPENGSPRPNRLLEVSQLGRVRMPLSSTGTPAHPGVVAPAEQLVTCEDPELADLPTQLLGRTLIVHDLDTARAIAANTSGYRFVTLQGELLEVDGTLTVGTHHAEAGILSRKSELRELRQRVLVLDRRIVESEQDLAQLREQATDADQREKRFQEAISVLMEQTADLHSRVEQHRRHRAELHSLVLDDRTEISTLEQAIPEREAQWREVRVQFEAADQQAHALQARVTQATHEVFQREQQLQQRQQERTAARVALAQVKERLTALRAKHQQIDADLTQRRREQAEGECSLREARQQLDESQRKMLWASSLLAEGYVLKEAAERQLVELNYERDVGRQERQRLAERSQAARSAWQAQWEQAHARELEVNDLRHRRDTLVGRLREDYQLELAELYERHRAGAAPAVPENTEVEASVPASLPDTSPLAAALALDSNAANEEIAELKRKLSRLGTVNLDSLLELAELESRARTLQVQFDDLAAAKRSLEEIIAKINNDSRRLFTETFVAIRTHFQELFRKLFGGGMADIVLEDDNDILDCGIEIIARPPGKELRSISLMSGGEKTLTAVALLLAIFRSKPSPFCILDEVDAALDEANIGRFTAVLREFLDRSQFIIVTHSKRTMATADVLYGVTMQESGVSKRVAVRFEDWPDDGQAPTNGSATTMGVGR